MLRSAYALHHNSHLFLAQQISRGLYICPASAVENGCIDAFDCLSKHSQHLVPVLHQRYHICRIHTGKRLIAAVFKLRTGSDSKRRPCGIYIYTQLLYKLFRETCRHELRQDLFVGNICIYHILKVIFQYELIEIIGCNHHGAWNRDLDPLVFFSKLVLVYETVKKCQTSCLATYRPFSHT